MTLAVVGTLSTNKQSNKQKATKNPLNFSMMSYGRTSTVMGSGSILLNRKPKNGLQGKKETRHCRIRRHQIDQIKTKKMILARNSHITSVLNLITYVLCA